MASCSHRRETRLKEILNVRRSNNMFFYKRNAVCEFCPGLVLNTLLLGVLQKLGVGMRKDTWLVDSRLAGQKMLVTYVLTLFCILQLHVSHCLNQSASQLLAL